MTAFWWCESEDGRPLGPFADVEIRRMIAEGAIPPQVRIWSRDRRPWPPGDPAAASLTPASRLPSPAPFGLIVATAAAVLLLGLALYGLVCGGVDDPSPPGAWCWPLVSKSLGAGSIAVAAGWWIAPARRGAGIELQAGLRVAAVIGALLCLIVAELGLSRSTGAAVLAAATADWTYDVHPGPGPKAVFVEGAIGTGFAEAVAEALDQAGDGATVSINSAGGLAGEALDAAAAIEAHHANVAVREGCASACLIVLMAGARRLADIDSGIGFHAGSPVTPNGGALADWEMRRIDHEVDAYLVRRGAPQAYMDEARRRGPDQLLEIPALEALDKGVLTGVYDHGRLIQRGEARGILAASPPKPASPSAPRGSASSRTAPPPRP